MQCPLRVDKVEQSCRLYNCAWFNADGAGYSIAVVAAALNKVADALDPCITSDVFSMDSAVRQEIDCDEG